MDFTHINSQGHARMVDISSKDDTKRFGTACAVIHMQPETFKKITNHEIKKGDDTLRRPSRRHYGCKKNTGYYSDVSSPAFNGCGYFI